MNTNFGAVSFSDIGKGARSTATNSRISGTKVRAGGAVIRNSFGAVELSDIGGSVDIQNANGRIQLRDARGAAILHTRFGAIDAAGSAGTRP